MSRRNITSFNHLSPNPPICVLSLSSSALNKFPFKTDFLCLKSVFIVSGPPDFCCHTTVEDAVSSLSVLQRTANLSRPV